MTFLEMAAAFGVVCGGLVAALTLMEKLTGVGGRWLAKGVAKGIEELRADVNDVKSKQLSMNETLDEVQHLQLYHLGENGGSPRMHDRVAAIEGVLRFVGASGDRLVTVDWNAPYDDEDDA